MNNAPSVSHSEAPHDTQPRNAPHGVNAKKSPGFPVEIVAAVAFVGLLLGLLGFFTLSDPRKDETTPTTQAAAAAAAPLGAAASPTFEMFRHPKSAPERPVLLAPDDTVLSTDGFTFALHNLTGKDAWFVLFGMDTSDTMFWFFPQSDAHKDARSLPLSPTPGFIVPEGVSPEGVKAGAFRVFALFTPEPVSIHEVEEGYRQGGAQALEQAVHGHVQELPLTLATLTH